MRPSFSIEHSEQLRAEGYTPSVRYVTSYQYTGKVRQHFYVVVQGY